MERAEVADAVQPRTRRTRAPPPRPDDLPRPAAATSRQIPPESATPRRHRPHPHFLCNNSTRISAGVTPRDRTSPGRAVCRFLGLTCFRGTPCEHVAPHARRSTCVLTDFCALRTLHGALFGGARPYTVRDRASEGWSGHPARFVSTSVRRGPKPAAFHPPRKAMPASARTRRPPGRPPVGSKPSRVRRCGPFGRLIGNDATIVPTIARMRLNASLLVRKSWCVNPFSHHIRGNPFPWTARIARRTRGVDWLAAGPAPQPGGESEAVQPPGCTTATTRVDGGDRGQPEPTTQVVDRKPRPIPTRHASGDRETVVEKRNSPWCAARPQARQGRRQRAAQSSSGCKTSRR